ncbi:MAG: hypothetical protein ACHQPI_13245 [Thermoanaerobaculia bacterium]
MPHSRLGLPLAGALLAASLAAPDAFAGGFFDGLPRRGYVQEDIQYDAVHRGSGIERRVVATIRFLSVRLDPGRSSQAGDLWPVRSMLLIEYAEGVRVIFERIDRPPEPQSPADARPFGRIGLDGGAVEMFLRDEAPATGTAGPGVCGGRYAILRGGSRELPVAPEDLDAPTVRYHLGRFLEWIFSSSDQERIERSVQLALRASQSQALPLQTFEMLKTLFPGREFSPAAEGLVFEATLATPLDPSSPGFRNLTEALELVPGVPAY